MEQTSEEEPNELGSEEAAKGMDSRSGLPGEPAACNYWLVSMDCGLLWGTVAK